MTHNAYKELVNKTIKDLEPVLDRLKQYDRGEIDIDTARIKDFLEREGTEER